MPSARISPPASFPNIKIFLPHLDGTHDVLNSTTWTSGTETVLRSPELHARVRTYTVRRYDREKNTLSIDFVLHGDEGIASARGDVGTARHHPGHRGWRWTAYRAGRSLPDRGRRNGPARYR